MLTAQPGLHSTVTAVSTKTKVKGMNKKRKKSTMAGGACATPGPSVTTPQDFMKEVVDAECEARLSISAATAKEKTEHERIKHQTAHDTAVTVERMRIEAQEKQAVAAHAH